MRYNVGPSTWGHPIVWGREETHHALTGTNVPLDDLTPENTENYSSLEFAYLLQGYLTVDSHIFTWGPSKSRGWYHVTYVAEWYAKVGWDVITFLNISGAYIDGEYVTRKGEDIELLKWAHVFGFVPNQYVRL